MSTELGYLLIILALFSLYGWLSGIEGGISLLRLFPKLAPTKPARKVFTPRWEITNLFLVFGCLGIALRFPGALDSIVDGVWPVLIIGLAALLVRAGLMCYMFWHKSLPGKKVSNWMLAAVSFIVPLSLGSAGIFMVTGEPFWSSSAGLALFVSLTVGLAALSVGFVHYIGGKRAPVGVLLLGRFLNMALAGLLALVLLEVLRTDDSHLLSLPYAYFAIISAGLVLMQAVCMAAGKEWRMWWCLSALALLAPFLIGLANYPYLIFPDVTIEAAFRDAF